MHSARSITFHSPADHISLSYQYLLIEMKGLRKILQVSWTAKKTNEWVINKAGVKRELLDAVKARKLAYYGHTTRKQGRKAWRKR